MGLIKAAFGAVGGSLGDQWKDFLTAPTSLQPSAAIFPAVRSGSDSNRGSNHYASQAVLTNGTKIIVPEGYGLLLFEDGALTGFSSEPGGFIWDSENLDSRSIFVGDGATRSLVIQSWERFKFGGRPGVQQIALFVRLKEIPNNKFGTQSEIYWDDAYLNSQVGATTRGTYNLQIIDPISFAIRFVPAAYLQGNAIFDFSDPNNPASSQIFSEVVGSLAAAFSLYTNSVSHGNRITKIQQDSQGFARSLAQAVEDAYSWKTSRGLSISNVSIHGIAYDESTKELLRIVQRADALTGARGNANLQASVAAGFAAAGEGGGAGEILGLGIAAGSAGVPLLMQNTPSAHSVEQEAASTPDLLARIQTLKRALEAGLIDQSEFNAAKAKALGL